jgi:hypothetical protein
MNSSRYLLSFTASGVLTIRFEGRASTGISIDPVLVSLCVTAAECHLRDTVIASRLMTKMTSSLQPFGRRDPSTTVFHTVFRWIQTSLNAFGALGSGDQGD